jgi:hypothetical protein
MPLAGNLRQFALPDVLRAIESGQRTGILVITHDQLQANAYFSGGQWLLAERVGAVQPLAQLLVRSGYITPEAFETAFGIAFAQAGSISDAQLVRGLITNQVLTQEQLHAFAFQDATALLAVILTWPEGDFIFEDGMTIPRGRVALPLSVGPLLTRATQLARPHRPLRETPVLAPEVVLDFAEVDPRASAPVQVTRDQWRLLTALDGDTPLWAIAENLEAPEPFVLRLAGELLASGVAVIAGRVAQATA